MRTLSTTKTARPRGLLVLERVATTRRHPNGGWSDVPPQGRARPRLLVKRWTARAGQASICRRDQLSRVAGDASAAQDSTAARKCRAGQGRLLPEEPPSWRGSVIGPVAVPDAQDLRRPYRSHPHHYLSRRDRNDGRSRSSKTHISLLGMNYKTFRIYYSGIYCATALLGTGPMKYS